MKNLNEYLKSHSKINWNLLPEELAEESIKRGEAVLSNTGALVVDTGEFTGRSPKDRYIVKDAETSSKVAWGAVNLPFESSAFQSLKEDMLQHAAQKELYGINVAAGASNKYTYCVKVISELPWQIYFVHNMFIRLGIVHEYQLETDWTVLALPSFKANPSFHQTRQHNFTILNFTEKEILIGGSAYTGEIKKGVFSALNYLMPLKHQVFPMHCSVNEKKDGKSVVYFGLSGTGKTTLSTNPSWTLIGDDEHGWADDEVFNFEGGCYAKVIDISEETEPEILHAIHHGALLENIVFKNNSREPNYHDGSKTLNTRVSYPLNHILNTKEKAVAGLPSDVIFLTCDANGVFPPISKLNHEQAMYHFITGYTSKIAGTEEGVNEPKSVFSTGFGEPFLPLDSMLYASMLGDKMLQQKVNVWLVNTGWSGGPYGVGSRIKLKYTRALINAAVSGELNKAEYDNFPVFNLQIPKTVKDVPSELLDPRKVWKHDVSFDEKLNKLAALFIENFTKYKSATPEIIAGGPMLKS